MKSLVASITLVSLLLTHSLLQAGSSNSLMDISADGKILACSNRDSGSVTIVGLPANNKHFEISVGQHPEGVSFLGDTHLLAVAVYDEDKVVIIDSKTGKIKNEIAVFDEPYGIVSNKSGDRLYVTLDYPGRIVEINADDSEIIKEITLNPFLRGIAISNDDRSLYTTNYYSANVTRIDIDSGKIIDEWAGSSQDNLSRQLTLHPTRPKVYLPYIRSRVTVAHGSGSIFPVVSIVDTRKEISDRRSRIPMDSFSGTRVTANPWEIAISPDAKTALVIFAGTNDMFACDVIDDDYRELTHRESIRLGNNPRAARYSPDGRFVYVYNALDFEIVVFRASTMRRIDKVKVSSSPMSAKELLGKKLFYTALQPMSGRNWISCASCHPDGQADGKTWHNPEGLRNTQSLAGMSWTHPIHWSADRDEVQDFEHTIRGPLMQGRGLSRPRLNEQLGKPNRGLHQKLDALAAYSNTHKFTLSPYSKNGLTESAKRGQKIFLSKKTQCAKCHSGPFYSDSNPKFSPMKKHDVGSAKIDPGEKMGPEYDTPTLLGIYRTAPYLHHGKAKTLKELFTKYNPDNQHGTTSHLKEQDIDDLVNFLKALPFKDPIPEAKQAGLVQVKD